MAKIEKYECEECGEDRMFETSMFHKCKDGKTGRFITKDLARYRWNEAHDIRLIVAPGPYND